MATSITISISGDGDAHVCGPMCDCPTALYQTQVAIDTDRREQGMQPRGLSERLQAMRYGAPTTAWFEEMALEAVRLETMAATSRVRDWIIRDHPDSDAAVWAAECDAADAATPEARAIALRTAIEPLVPLLASADLLPADHEYVWRDDSGEAVVHAGHYRFVVSPTATSAARNGAWIVTTSDERSGDDTDGTFSERVSVDRQEIRAWLVAWAAANTYA
jgi:hypothetical protein